MRRWLCVDSINRLWDSISLILDFSPIYTIQWGEILYVYQIYFNLNRYANSISHRSHWREG